MATQWYWREQDCERGPISFQDLVSKVREHSLNEDDLVRPHYSKDWQTTDTVVGLFYMAQRVPVPRPESAPVGASIEEAIATNIDSDYRNETRSYRLDEVGRDLEAHSVESDVYKDMIDEVIDPNSSLVCDTGVSQSATENPAESDMSAAILAAAEDWDRRHVPAPNESPPEPERVRPIAWILQLPWLLMVGLGSLVQFVLAKLLHGVGTVLAVLARTLGIRQISRQLERIASRQTLSWWFRIGFSFAVAGLVAFAVVSWSDYEDLRFPNSQRLASGKKTFPIYGPCLPVEYTFMLTDIILVGGVLGYFAARGLESMAED